MPTGKWPPLAAVRSILRSRCISLLTVVLVGASGASSLAEENGFADGVDQFKLGHYPKAAAIFEHCMASHPINSELYYYAAITYERLGDYKRAVELYKYVLLHFPYSEASSQSSAALQRSSFQKILRTKGISSDLRDPHLDTYPRETWVEFTRHNNTLLMDGTINDRPIKMIFDTGASSCVFSVDQLEQLGIPVPKGSPNAMTYGVGSTRKMPVWAVKADLRLGKIERRQFPIIVCPNPLAYPLLGESFFHDLTYTIDNNAKAVLFKHDDRLEVPVPDSKSTCAMTVSSTGNYVYNVPFTIENHALIVVAKIDGRECPMIFDTGADVCMFTNAELDQYGIKAHFSGHNYNVRGASGTTSAQMCVIERAEVGPIFGAMPCLVTDQAIVPKPLLGQSFFKDWQYTIDQTNHVIQFARR